MQNPEKENQREHPETSADPKNEIVPAKAAERDSAHSPVRRTRGEGVAREAVDGGGRRDFFSEAMRETLGPFAGMLERKIQPFINALEALPYEAERLANVTLPAALDQPQTRTYALPVAPEPVAVDRLLRPPGAMAPAEFETVCSRCGKCVEACPANAIQMDPYRAVADGLPFVRAADQACVVCDDLSCMPACPTGALRMVDRFHINMGTAKVDRWQCVREHGEECTRCVEACPITGEGTSPFGDAIFIHAETGRVRVRRNACVGCGLCENRCPTEPKAIVVIPYAAPVWPIVA